MPLNVTKKGDREYLYFTIDGSSKLYLGTADKPNKGRIEQAIQQMNLKIRKFENEVQRLTDYIQKESKEYNIVYRLVVFDLDGVIFDKPWHDESSEKVAVSTWDVLFKEMHLYDAHEKFKQEFENGDISYMQWTEKACNALKLFSLDRETFENIINRRPFSQGALEVFQVLHAKGTKTAVITGSFDALAQRAKKGMGGIDHVLAHTKLYFNPRGLLERCELQASDYQDKAAWVEKIAEKEAIPLSECAYIGDDVNDIPAFKKVGMSISFNSSKAIVNENAKVVVDSRDLKSILPHLCVKK